MQEEKGTTEDEMVRLHHRIYGHEFEKAPGVGDGQGSLACCSPWGCKESNTTEQLNQLTDSSILVFFLHLCQVASIVFNSATLWTVAFQAPLSLGFSRQEYWSGLPCPSPVQSPRDRTSISYVFCIGKQALYHYNLGNPLFPHMFNFFLF